MKLACCRCGLIKEEDEFYLKHWKVRRLATRKKNTPSPRNHRTSECKKCKLERDQEMRERRLADPIKLAEMKMKQIEKYKNSRDRNWEGRQTSRARKYGVNGVVTWKEWQEIIAAHNNKCHWCGMELHPSYQSLDHVIPLGKGGPHTKENVVPACMNCNNKRKWYEQTKYFEMYGVSPVMFQDLPERV